ncbi:hypothetical protein L3X38_002877 [Prunus dulcis]|uniref:Sieve element occlusion N-terminal domain-containing protein n=1 Tax=Prunus dulcis TaxID=3755 RepID=A0AAD4ZLC8_PRUDU|nr:hypothetical protein L3X38_002877 [Prunus dulcis]
MQGTIQGEQSLFTRSEDEILEVISGNHVPEYDTSLDVPSLFSTARNIITASFQTIDNLVQGIQGLHIETINEKSPEPSYSSPFCSPIESIRCQMAYYRVPSDTSIEACTLEILKKLSKYSWETKAVLALAAFALEYEEFDQLAKSVGIKRHDVVVELNNLIKATLEVIDYLLKLESLFRNYDVPSTASAMKDIPVIVYWSILTIVACAMTKVTVLTSYEEDMQYNLSKFLQKIQFILANLRGQLAVCKREIEDQGKTTAEGKEEYLTTELMKNTEFHWQVPESMHDIDIIPYSAEVTLAEVLHAFKDLVFPDDNVQPLIDGSTKEQVDIEVLSWNSLFILFSSLDISEADISILKPVYEETKKEDNNYKIVWIPIVDKWTDALREKFVVLMSKMPWYTLQYFEPDAACVSKIKEEWHFKDKPMVVVMDSEGEIKNTNALPWIQKYGIKAFPFHEDDEHHEKKGLLARIFHKGVSVTQSQPEPQTGRIQGTVVSLISNPGSHSPGVPETRESNVKRTDKIEGKLDVCRHRHI